MPNHVCWLCKARTGHELVTDPRYLNFEADTGVLTEDGEELKARPACAAFRCTVCQGLSVALTTVDPGNIVLGHPHAAFSQLSGECFTWYPRATDTRSYPDVPAHVGDAASEAYECFSGGHYRAAILMARAVIEATAKTKGITSGDLRSKIDKLAEGLFIRPHIKAVAHTIRQFGNEMAHGDFVAPVSAVECGLIITLMGEILNEVFQSPAKLEAAAAAFSNLKNIEIVDVKNPAQVDLKYPD